MLFSFAQYCSQHFCFCDCDEERAPNFSRGVANTSLSFIERRYKMGKTFKILQKRKRDEVRDKMKTTHSGISYTAMNTSNLFISHYAYQSKQDWKFKKMRGNFNNAGSARRGSLPRGYNAIEDTQTLVVLTKRIDQVYRWNPDLGRCLSRSFLS